MNIKALRELTGFTQKEFGERLGLTSQSITKYESGANVSETVKRLIRYEFSRWLPDDEKLSIQNAYEENSDFQLPPRPQIENNEFIRSLRETINELRKDKDFLKELINKQNQ